jgi:hypothetical protein
MVVSWWQEEAVLLLDVEGMKCAGCSGAVQRLLSAQVRVSNPNPSDDEGLYSVQRGDRDRRRRTRSPFVTSSCPHAPTAPHRAPFTSWIRSPRQAHRVVHSK